MRQRENKEKCLSPVFQIFLRFTLYLSSHDSVTQFFLVFCEIPYYHSKGMISYLNWNLDFGFFTSNLANKQILKTIPFRRRRSDQKINSAIIFV